MRAKKSQTGWVRQFGSGPLYVHPYHAEAGEHLLPRSTARNAQTWKESVQHTGEQHTTHFHEPVLTKAT